MIPEFCNPNLSSVRKPAEKGTNPGGLGGGSSSEAYVIYQVWKRKS